MSLKLYGRLRPTCAVIEGDVGKLFKNAVAFPKSTRRKVVSALNTSGIKMAATTTNAANAMAPLIDAVTGRVLL